MNRMYDWPSAITIQINFFLVLLLEWRLKSKWSAMKLRVYRNSDVIWSKEKPDQEDKTLGKISLQVKK